MKKKVNDSNNDFPRKYKSLLQFMDKKKNEQQQQGKVQEKKQHGIKTRRIDDECRTLIHQTAQQTNKTKIKKKEYLKNKRRAAKSKTTEQEQDSQFNVIEKKGQVKVYEKIPFGMQAQEPPKLTALPKKRKSYLPSESQPSSSSCVDNAKEAATMPSSPEGPKRKRKLKLLSASERMNILNERQKMIDLYRQLKKSKEPSMRVSAREALDEDELEGYDPEDVWNKFN